MKEVSVGLNHQLLPRLWGLWGLRRGGVWNSGFEMQGFRGLGCRVRACELWARGGGLNFGALGLGFRDCLEGLALVSAWDHFLYNQRLEWLARKCSGLGEVAMIC